MENNRRLLVAAMVALLVVAVAYTRWHLTPSGECTLLQTRLDSVTPELLAEKNPVVLLDRVTRHADLLRTVFRFQYVWAASPAAATGDWQEARSRFTLLCAPPIDGYDGALVDITHPRRVGGIVRVVLRPGQTLVLPPWWWYRAEATAMPAAMPEVRRLYALFDAIAVACKKTVGLLL